MAGRIPVYRRVGDVLRMRSGKADRGICTSCHRMPSRALPPATAQLDDLCAHPPRLPQLHHARVIGICSFLLVARASLGSHRGCSCAGGVVGQMTSPVPKSRLAAETAGTTANDKSPCVTSALSTTDVRTTGRGTSSRSTTLLRAACVSAGQSGCASERVRRQGLEPRTRGLRVDRYAAPGALPAQIA